MNRIVETIEKVKKHQQDVAKELEKKGENGCKVKGFSQVNLLAGEEYNQELG